MWNKIVLLGSVIYFTNLFGFGSISRPLRLFPILLLTYFFYSQKHIRLFDSAILTMLTGVALSIFSCYIFRGQSMIYTLVASVNYISIGLYFLFINKRFKSSEILWTLTTTGAALTALYLIQYILYQKGIYLVAKSAEYSDLGENMRFRIVSSAAIYFAYFKNLYDYLKSHKVINLLILGATIIATLIMNFRSIILGLLIGTFIMLIMMQYNWKKLILPFIAILFVGIIFANNDFIQGRIEHMLLRQETQTFSNEDYVRFNTLKYYTQEHFKNWIEYFLGSGLTDGHSKYYKYMLHYEGSGGIHYSDWGLLGMSWYLGITTLIGIILYCYKAIRLKIYSPYVKAWIIFLFCSSMLVFELPREGNFIIQALALAYLTQLYKEKRLHNIIKKHAKRQQK